ncbi:MAG: hypothetical protein CME64_08360 [Halobacteriovoraceae bacterium]|nr:hypothetical protein [Halobacteriovoraceae bacterium]
MPILFSIFLCVCLQSSAVWPVSDSWKELQEHLDKFAQVNQPHHDNIDIVFHTHSHKHSDDGEEHEHHHEHNKTPKYEIHLSFTSFNEPNLGFLTTKTCFGEKSFFSKPSPDKPFRPPIS